MPEFEASPRAGASSPAKDDGPEERSGKLRLRVVDED